MRLNLHAFKTLTGNRYVENACNTPANATIVSDVNYGDNAVDNWQNVISDLHKRHTMKFMKLRIMMLRLTTLCWV